jgi:uncharacterized SAM-binding protein YcdF (DUF218 family)
MSFVLSKLLPLFVYPVGLSLLLLAYALFQLTRKRRLKSPRAAIIAIGSAIAILYVSSMPVVSDLLLRSLEYQNLPAQNLPNADAIVVLGGGTKAQIPPRPWIDVSEAGDRILHGSRLWLQKKAPLLILSGGRTSLFKEGGRAESEDMAEIAEALGVPAQVIVQDRTSINTYENAVNIKQILEQRQLNQILLVTSAIHMPRSLALFRKLGIEAIAAPTDFLTTDAPEPEFTSILFGVLPDANALKNTTNVLKEYIGLVISKISGII